jgi:hypothetical protein
MRRLARTFRSRRGVRHLREDWRCEALLMLLGRPGCPRESGPHLRGGPASATEISLQDYIRITYLYFYSISVTLVARSLHRSDPRQT